MICLVVMFGRHVTTMSLSESTKIALITGANKGIGFAIAKQLAIEHVGYHILIGSRDYERGAKAKALDRRCQLKHSPST